MQVNTRAGHDAAVARITTLSGRIDKLNAGIATGSRLQSADDDPVAAARVLQIDRTLAATASRRTGIDRAASRLGSSDAALDGMATLLQRAKEVSLLGATATLNAADRATLAAEVEQLAEQLLGYANARDSDGATLFAGARTGSPAYAADAAGAVVWQGAGSAALLALDGGRIATGVDGPAILAGLLGAAGPTDAFRLLADLGAALATSDAAVRASATAAAQTGLDAAISRVADTRASVGTRLARLDTEGLRLDAQVLALGGDRAKAASLDVTQAYAELSRLSTVLQAAQLSFAKVANLSLWAMLR